MSDDSTKKPQFELKEDGNVVNNKGGKEIPLAHFDAETGHLEFVSQEIDRKFRVQVQRAVTEDIEGNLKNNAIVSYGIKGVGRDEVKDNIPPRPKPSRLLGDKTEEIVDWYFQYKPKEFIARYGVQTKVDGSMRRGPAVRYDKRVGVIDSHGQIGEKMVRVFEDNAILATRGTHLTFTLKEHEDAKREMAGEAGADDSDDRSDKELDAERKSALGDAADDDYKD